MCCFLKKRAIHIVLTKNIDCTFLIHYCFLPGRIIFVPLISNSTHSSLYHWSQSIFIVSVSANASTFANAKSLSPASLLILLFTPQPAVARSARAKTPERNFFFSLFIVKLNLIPLRGRSILCASYIYFKRAVSIFL